MHMFVVSGVCLSVFATAIRESSDLRPFVLFVCIDPLPPDQ